jgi:hypothetical protein
MGIFDLHHARARRSVRRSSANVDEVTRTGVAAFYQLERGARALIPVAAAAAASLAEIRQVGPRLDQPHAFAAVDEAAQRAATALRELGDLAGALERIAAE